MKNGFKAIKVSTETIVPLLLSFSYIPQTVSVAIILGALKTLRLHLLTLSLMTTSWFVKSRNGK